MNDIERRAMKRAKATGNPHMVIEIDHFGDRSRTVINSDEYDSDDIQLFRPKLLAECHPCGDVDLYDRNLNSTL